jgi:SsrA-binding protein
MATKKAKPADPTLARNRQASHEFHILETHEAGIELLGTEVKALRAGRATLREGYIRVERGEIWLYSVNIPPYEQGSHNNHDPVRRRRLLMHKREIVHLEGFVQQQGLTMIPLRLYTSGNKIKLEFGVVRGKKLWDKRQDIASRDAKREADRAQARMNRQ